MKTRTRLGNARRPRLLRIEEKQSSDLSRARSQTLSRTQTLSSLHWSNYDFSSVNVTEFNLRPAIARFMLHAHQISPLQRNQAQSFPNDR